MNSGFFARFIMSNILGFRGKNFYLSNFYKCCIWYNGKEFNNAEQAFQYTKIDNSDMKSKRAMMRANTPSEAKHIGRKCKMRPDWEKIKYNVMFEIVMEKFCQNKELKSKLLKTGNAYLEETNTWGDKFWGCCPSGKGENNLGKILMLVREKLRKKV